MKNEKILQFASKTKQLKEDFKKMIDEMEDAEFIEFMHFIIECEEDYDDFDEDFDDDLDDDFDDFWNSEDPLSGEMINFKCPICKKISAYPIEFAEYVYKNTNKEPTVECYHCDCEDAVPMYFKTTDGQVFKN